MKTRAILLALSFLLAACGDLAEEAPASKTPPPQSAPAAGAMFAAQCAMCHGENGAGSQLVPEAADFTDPSWQKSRTDEQIAAAIRGGVPGTSMPPFPALDENEVAALVRHVRALGRVDS